MKKRVISLLLTLAVLLTGFTVTATAAQERPINGVRYTVVTTAAELVDGLKAGKNVMMANDIELTADLIPQGTALGLNPGIILDGNGYTLTYAGARRASLLQFNAGTESLKGSYHIRNLSFGAKDDPFIVLGAQGLFADVIGLGCELIFENVNFYVERRSVNANSGAIFASLGTVAHFRGCTLDVEMVNVLGGTLHGGWIGEIAADGQVEFDDCVATGTVNGRGGAAGFVAQNTAGDLEFNHCRNLVSVTAPGFVAGFVGNMGMGCVTTYAADCINFGSITATGSGYDAVAGGIFGRVSNRKTIATWRLHVMYRCSNYGTVTAGTAAGGIMGHNHDHDYVGRTYLTISGCENFGTVKGGTYAGGIAGSISPTVYAAELTDCVNIGCVTSNAYAGNFAGLLSVGASLDQAAVLHTVVEGGYAAGIVKGAAGKLGTIAGQTSGSHKITVGPYAERTVDVVAPQYKDVTYYGALVNLPTGVTKESDLGSLTKALGARLGAELVAADADDASAYVAFASPTLRGIQLSAVESGKLSIRLLAGLYAKDAYRSLGYEVTVTDANGASETKRYTTKTLLTNVKENNGSQASTVQAEQLSAKYLFAAELTDIPASGRVTVRVTPFAIGKGGSVTYTGSCKTLAVVNGRVTNESMALNGALLDSFAIVYKATNTMAEKTLATHLSQRIAELTGVDLPVMKENLGHNRKYTINVGKLSAAGTVPAGRNISTLENGISIVISGDTTAQLGEAVTHFIDLLEENVAAGSNSLRITEPIQAPADSTISIMSFNMGAADDGNIKAAEWDLLVEYLPDIFTAQEPWAGFLDDFCNNHAVRPTTKFKESASDDDVMETDVDNKAFTGDDYYGIYWGMPRWTPDGPNANQGKASYSVIFYAKDRFTVNEAKSGTFMFSDTPDVIGSKISKSSMPRCATYAMLTDVNTGKEFVVVNVHLDHKNGQVEQATILVNELIKRVGKDTPMLITGDMNSNLTSSAIQHMMTNPTMPLSSFDYLATETYWSDAAKFGIIDWIFTNTPEKIDVTYYRFCNDFNMFYTKWTGSLQMYMPSDHPAIYCEFRFQN